MKKILTSLVTAAVIATAVNADFVRIEAGAGAWMNTPSGSLSYSETKTVLGFSSTTTGEYKSKEESKTSGYAWMLVKHPIPILPNNILFASATNWFPGPTKISAGALPKKPKAIAAIAWTPPKLRMTSAPHKFAV